MNKLSKTQLLIVTLCKSPNFGAYLQAFALKEVLTSYGYQVSFLDIYDKENTKKLYRHLFGGVRRRPSAHIFNIRKLIAFKKAEKELKIISRSDLSKFKAIFIGSDEVWSVTNGTFKSAPEFFGLNLPDTLKFSYAPSVGSSKVKDLSEYPEYTKGISNLDLISVRDSESRLVAEYAAPNYDITTVLDPTFLYDFSKNEAPYDIDKPYILVYTYGFNKKIIKEIKAYAKKNKLLLVSAGFHHKWADKNIACTPFEFLSIVKNAQYVVTDTFHGSIFAIKYRKNFLSYGGHKPKVKYLLESLNLSDALAEVGRLTKKSKIKTDYSNLDRVLNPKLDISREFLDRCDNQIKK